MTVSSPTAANRGRYARACSGPIARTKPGHAFKYAGKIARRAPNPTPKKPSAALRL
ncbi:MAG: hypothetical protein ACM3MB_04185 [Acidobacteriota bacterium]